VHEFEVGVSVKPKRLSFDSALALALGLRKRLQLSSSPPTRAEPIAAASLSRTHHQHTKTEGNMDTPHIYRPQPRRPFETKGKLQTSSLEPSNPSLLSSPEIHDTPSRTHSMLNLTSSTLGGIYSQGGHDIESEPPSTPWGTEADSPPRTQNPPAYRRLSFVTPPPPKPATTLSLLLRSVLLFGTGMLYGLLVRHLHDDRQLAPFQVEGIIKPSHDWKYLVFWGIAGVGLGSLLPWFDKLWDVKLGTSTQDRGLTSSEEAIKSDKAQGILGADWILAVRGVGAFVGIAYAIVSLAKDAWNVINTVFSANSHGHRICKRH
jgi:hypothetical protein